MDQDEDKYIELATRMIDHLNRLKKCEIETMQGLREIKSKIQSKEVLKMIEDVCR